VAYLKEYVNPEGTPNPIQIRSRTARKWLNKLGYTFHLVGRNVFIDGHERPDVIKSRIDFLNTLKDLEPYLVEFDEHGRILDKAYPSDCQIGGSKRRPIIYITHDECTFASNDGPRFSWQGSDNIPFRPKSKGRGIMVSEFLLPFGRLDLSTLSEQARENLMTRCALKSAEAVEIFEFGKNNRGYWDGADLVKQIKEKALPIAEALYPGYSLLFVFDNATSHSVYKSDALRVRNMAKGPGGKQAFLRDGWYERGGIVYAQKMFEELENGVRRQKGIQKVLAERGLWPVGGLKLECPRPCCFKCESRAACKKCVKGTRCDICKVPKVHTGTIECTASRKCDGCAERQAQCTCVPKVTCSTCATRTSEGKCGDCEELPPKCEGTGELYPFFPPKTLTLDV
jgi:hypothetical protein